MIYFRTHYIVYMPIFLPFAPLSASSRISNLSNISTTTKGHYALSSMCHKWVYMFEYTCISWTRKHDTALLVVVRFLIRLYIYIYSIWAFVSLHTKPAPPSYSQDAIFLLHHHGAQSHVAQILRDNVNMRFYYRVIWRDLPVNFSAISVNHCSIDRTTTMWWFQEYYYLWCCSLHCLVESIVIQLYMWLFHITLSSF